MLVLPLVDSPYGPCSVADATIRLTDNDDTDENRDQSSTISTMSRENRETLYTEIPAEAKEIVDEQNVTNWEFVTEAIFEYAGGEQLDSVPALRRQINRMERDLRNLREEHRDLGKSIERKETRRSELKDRLHALEEEQQTTVEKLDALLDAMVDSEMNVFVGHSRVENIARFEYAKTDDETQQQVLDDLQERATERDLDLVSERFEEYDNGGGW